MKFLDTGLAQVLAYKGLEWIVILLSVCLIALDRQLIPSTEPFTVLELAARYGVSRQQIFERLKATDLTPMKRGNRSFFTPDQVIEFDRIDELLKQGFSLRDIADDR